MTASPLKVVRFDRDAMSIENLTKIVSLPEGRRAAERWRELNREGRKQLCDLQAQLADIDEILLRLDLVLDGGVNA